MRCSGVLARLRFLRGGALDLFGRTQERRLERDLIAAYEKDIGELLPLLATSTLDTAVELAGLPELIRGFGHIKLRSAEAAQKRRQDLLMALRKPDVAASRAA